MTKLVMVLSTIGALVVGYTNWQTVSKGGNVNQPKISWIAESAEEEEYYRSPYQRYVPVEIECGIDGQITCTSRGGGR